MSRVWVGPGDSFEGKISKSEPMEPLTADATNDSSTKKKKLTNNSPKKRRARFGARSGGLGADLMASGPLSQESAPRSNMPAPRTRTRNSGGGQMSFAKPT
jgi:hypothetical protein